MKPKKTKHEAQGPSRRGQTLHFALVVSLRSCVDRGLGALASLPAPPVFLSLLRSTIRAVSTRTLVFPGLTIRSPRFYPLLCALRASAVRAVFPWSKSHPTTMGRRASASPTRKPAKEGKLCTLHSTVEAWVWSMWLLPRELRIEYEGAVYHVISRGNHCADVFARDARARRFLSDVPVLDGGMLFMVPAACGCGWATAVQCAQKSRAFLGRGLVF